MRFDVDAARSGVLVPARPLFRVGLSAICLAALAACGGGADEIDGSASESATEVQSWMATSSATACDTPQGRVLSVGPGQALAAPSAAAAVAQDGDVVRIAAGDYRGDVATWKASRLTICGEGGRARLWADGQSAQRKAIWVVAGADVIIDGIEFHKARVPDRNGAGIRAEHTGRLTVINSGFFDNENGILGGKGAEVVIERSEFARNGYGDGQSHNLYIGQAKSLTVTDSYFHEAKVGHNLKSRAAINRIENSYFVDGPSGTASYLADFPDGGQVFLRGNMFHKGPKAENSVAIAYAAERQTWSSNTLTLVHNTVVMTRAGGHYLRAPAHTQSVKLTANVFAGSPTAELIKGGFVSGNVQQTGNVFAAASQFPGADNTARPDFWPVAGLQDALVLTGVADAQYTADAPSQMKKRPLQGHPRLSGALQSNPVVGGGAATTSPAKPVPAPPVVTPPVVKPPVAQPPVLPPEVKPPVVKPAQPVTPPVTQPVVKPTPTRPPALFGPRPVVVPTPGAGTAPVACRPLSSGAATQAAAGGQSPTCPVPVATPPRQTTCIPFQCTILQRLSGPTAATTSSSATRAAG
jgi:hypothetical protein